MTKPSSNNTIGNKTLSVPCPTCQTKVLWNEDFPQRPFCSERCQLIDLGEWASEAHRIEGPSLDFLDTDTNISNDSEADDYN